MGIFSWFNWLNPRAEYAATDDYWYQPVAGMSTAGQAVSSSSAMRVAAYYAGVSRISRTLASVPLKVYRVKEKGQEVARNHPLWTLLHDRPNQWQTSYEWRDMMQGHLLVRGNAYSRIVPGARGPVDQLIPLNPDRMRVEQLPTGRLLYHYTQPNGEKIVYNQEYIFHLRGFSSDGILGIDPITLHRETLGYAQALVDYGSRFFQNDARPGIVLQHPGVLSEPAQERLKNGWRKRNAGPNKLGVDVLEEGMTAKELGLSNQNSQFLESRRLSIADIARILHIPPHMIGDLDRATFSNIEQQSIEYVVHTMMPWFVSWEQAMSRDLFVAPELYHAEFQVNGLLRGDIASRYAAYAVGRQWGWLSANEIRELENMNPREDDGGDAYLDPMNMQRSDQPISVAPVKPTRADVDLPPYANGAVH